MDPRLHRLLACTVFCGCFNPTGSPDLSGSTSSTGPATWTEASSGGMWTASSEPVSSSTTGLPASTSTGSTEAPDTSTTGSAVCGDGHLDAGEECDDGPLVAGCSSSCRLYRHVFVTSQVFTGDLGGLDGADAKCQAAAQAGDLSGTYRAWLSSLTESALDRLVHSQIPYRLVDGKEVASDWDDLTDGTLLAGINVSELKGAPGKGAHTCMPDSLSIVWTGTTETGSPVGGEYFCGGWASPSGSGYAGVAGSVDSTWTANCLAKCNDQASLYCVEQ